MSSADFAKRPLAERAKEARGYLLGEALMGGFVLILWGASYNIYLGLAALLCWALLFGLIVRRALEREIEALGGPDDDPRTSPLMRREPRPSDHRNGGRALRFALGFFHSVAIIIAVTLATALTAQLLAFVLFNRDVSAAFGSGAAGFVGGMLGLVIGIVIALRRIADGDY